MNARENSEPIPTDLITDILSRLPAKSIATCRCVSKLWDSLLRRTYFTELYLTRSRARPQILFACQKEEGEFFFFSSPQPQNPNEHSSLAPANYHMKLPFDINKSEICGSVHGLVCLTSHVKERNDTFPVICNPSTRQTLYLPKVMTNRIEVDSFIGYDPIDKEFKILSMTSPDQIVKLSEQHQILTLGADKTPSWRKIACSTPHYPISQGICINGVLYYAAATSRFSWVSLLVCFDFRSEEFMFIEKDEGMCVFIHSVLVNYKGKLAALMSTRFDHVTAETKCFEMWVLEDTEKHEWSKHVYEFPPVWKTLVADAKLRFVGFTSTNEILLSPHYLSDPFYVFYYNIENRTVRRVEIQGIDAFKNCRVHTYVDHVEDVKLIDL